MLYRVGLDANLTLGNKTSVDITVVRGPSDVITIDVKAVAKCMDWPLSSRPVANPDRHFLVLLCYNSQFTEPSVTPDAWVIPYAALGTDDLTKTFRGDMTCVIRKRVVETGARFKNQWEGLRAAAS